MVEAKTKSASSQGENDMCPTVRTVTASASRNSQRDAAAQSEKASQPMSLRMPRLKPWARRLSNAPRYQRSRCAHSIRIVGIRSVCALQSAAPSSRSR